jgi:glycerophosphoryl diester phosphodiesterase
MPCLAPGNGDVTAKTPCKVTVATRSLLALVVSTAIALAVNTTAALAVDTTAGTSAPAATAYPGCPELVAHDGYSGPAAVPGDGPVPPDSVAALQYAARLGAKAVKFDEQWSSDNVPVVIHNLTVNESTGRVVHGHVVRNRGNADQFPAASLERMHLLTLPGGYTQYRLPSAETMLKAAVAARMTSVIIEIKTPAITTAEARSLRAAVSSARATAITTVQTFFVQEIAVLRQVWPSLAVTLLEDSSRLPPAGVRSVVLRGKDVSARAVATLLGAALHVGAWSSGGAGVPDGAAAWTAERADGVQQIFTNDTRGYLAWEASAGCG